MKTSKIKSLGGALGFASALLLSVMSPVATANTYSLPNAPTSVTSYLGAAGVVVRWVPGAEVNPGVTGYVVSAGAGSCPIFVPAKASNVVTMPVVIGQPAGTPIVQAVNEYGFSRPTASSRTFSAAQLATVASPTNKAVQVLQLSLSLIHI